MKKCVPLARIFWRAIVGADAHIRPLKPMERDDVGIVPYTYKCFILLFVPDAVFHTPGVYHRGLGIV